jgi:DNA repair protein RadA/Sms
MAKKKINYECQHCGFTSSKWQGKCPECQAWNSFIEAVEVKTVKAKNPNVESRIENLSEILGSEVERIRLKNNELNRVLGGGIVPGSVLVIGGAPGIGKSTLLLQLVGEFSQNQQKSCYFSGEESPEQIKLRADRIEIHQKNILLSTENELHRIQNQIIKEKTAFVVIDSIQTIYDESIDSVPGSVSQIRACSMELIQLAKSKNFALVIIGHITKDGNIAGPKLLEHMVDVVLYFEGEKNTDSRVLRTFKNRFGETGEIGIFRMVKEGLVENKILLDFDENSSDSGVAFACVQEGTRFLFIDVQALVSNAAYGVPQRVATGFDHKRLAVLIAVIEKKMGLFLGDQDIFIKISSETKITDAALDLAVISAIISSFKNIPIQKKTVFFGEVALTGKVIKPHSFEKRIAESKLFGFEHFIFAENTGKINDLENII